MRGKETRGSWRIETLRISKTRQKKRDTKKARERARRRIVEV
jgi:hypothetical protein